MNRWLLNLMTLSCTMVCARTLKASPQDPQAAQNRQGLQTTRTYTKRRRTNYRQPEPDADEARRPSNREMIASRAGGAIHFPSDHITNFLILGRGLPTVGSQYILFFFAAVPSETVYEIAYNAVYEAKNGQVCALDEAKEQPYDAMSSSEFLDLVNKVIAEARQFPDRAGAAKSFPQSRKSRSARRRC